MQEWRNIKAIVEVPKEIEDDFMLELMERENDMVLVGRTEGTLAHIEVTVDGSVLDTGALHEIIKEVTEKYADNLHEYASVMVTFWEEFGFAKDESEEELDKPEDDVVESSSLPPQADAVQRGFI